MLAATLRRATTQGRRLMSDGLTAEGKIKSLPMVYIKGEEMTRYAAQLMLENWLEPHVDTSAWEFFDLSCAARDASNDQTLKDAVAAGAKIGAIFKEPTVTPSAEQVKEFGLSKPLPSPNGAMRRGWNGVTISRDTIHIDGVELGFKSPVLFERHAVGGEYGAGWKEVGKGRLITTYFPDKTAFEEGEKAIIVDARILDNERNVAVVYHNPLDNVEALAHHFFSRTLKAGVTPYVVTKKTVFKWQEPFWAIHKKVFDENYKSKFLEKGLLENTGGELQHLISDAATMQIIRWTRGGFGMSAHNYDGDMLTDEVAQVHRSPGFITSNLVGVAADGSAIKEFEASHGTVSDLWHQHLRGEPTSFNPLGMAEAVMGALSHAADLSKDEETARKTHEYVTCLRRAMHNTFKYGQGTWDMAGPSGLTTEQFVEKVGNRLSKYLAQESDDEFVDPSASKPSVLLRRAAKQVDTDKVQELFAEFDTDSDGSISVSEFTEMMIKLGLAPPKEPGKESASRAKIDEGA